MIGRAGVDIRTTCALDDEKEGHRELTDIVNAARAIANAVTQAAGSGAQTLGARSLWAISRPLPSEQFLEVWDFRVEACVTQDGDHFVFGDFVIVVASFVDDLGDCVELFLRDHSLFSLAGCDRGSFLFEDGA